MSKVGGTQLHIRNVNKSFGATRVLSGIDLNIKPGEFVAIVGRSGCGKSTLLRLIAGLDESTSGAILLDAQGIQGVHQDTRVLFQEHRLLPWKKNIDNVRIGIKSGDKEIAFKALQQVGLEHKKDDWPAVLSGGQRQRVALARALAGNPRLLLLDEPLGALDALTRIEMQQLIEQLWLEKQFTVLLVTHDVSEAVALADRVIVIEDGKIGLDLKISLARPREHDSGFAYFEKVILDRLLVKQPYETAKTAAEAFSI
ncbi:ATP-binding cassette domain-containing protein [Paenibacillus chondroitinus]|uniref:ATP-binding cassette domain-containing protein n=1 Tax=Paenibacillus chondroitinus TaxID=59842 RepID=A0ABU6DIQ1_9BACL|nr:MULTISPECIES: ATP-binding cassette domain-containing protein [Paenibacillus]MCY9662006.1 ATP-binding cassette domain-containing protein [Paenibacillus anseongense]MEB4797629.1 ATP-binding cassette domain-containing protein [Paenibacillus chondroitinus]